MTEIKIDGYAASPNEVGYFGPDGQWKDNKLVLHLLEQIEQLRKDAERYRWLQSIDTEAYVWIGGIGVHGKWMDDIVDAAMKETGNDTTRD